MTTLRKLLLNLLPFFLQLLMVAVSVSTVNAELVTLEGVNVDGIALGKDAVQLTKKYRIDSEYLSTCISTDGHALNEAKRIVSCVLRVASCKNSETRQGCLPDDFCVSPAEVQGREIEAMQCEGDEEQSAKIEKWASRLSFVIKPGQLICQGQKLFREVINAYMDGDKSLLIRETGYGCRVTEETQPIKIISSSRDGKTCHIQYQVPYSNDLSDGWTSRSGIISAKKYKNSRY